MESAGLLLHPEGWLFLEVSKLYSFLRQSQAPHCCQPYGEHQEPQLWGHALNPHSEAEVLPVGLLPILMAAAHAGGCSSLLLSLPQGGQTVHPCPFLPHSQPLFLLTQNPP